VDGDAVDGDGHGRRAVVHRGRRQCGDVVEHFVSVDDHADDADADGRDGLAADERERAAAAAVGVGDQSEGVADLDAFHADLGAVAPAGAVGGSGVVARAGAAAAEHRGGVFALGGEPVAVVPVVVPGFGEVEEGGDTAGGDVSGEEDLDLAVVGFDADVDAVVGGVQSGRFDGRFGVVGGGDAAGFEEDVPGGAFVGGVAAEGEPGDGGDGADGEDEGSDAGESALESASALPRGCAAEGVGGYWLVLGLGSGAAVGLHDSASYGASSRAR
jgi:hypothetical protein